MGLCKKLQGHVSEKLPDSAKLAAILAADCQSKGGYMRVKRMRKNENGEAEAVLDNLEF